LLNNLSLVLISASSTILVVDVFSTCTIHMYDSYIATKTIFEDHPPIWREERGDALHAPP
jgi:hypothetical protein